jgi:IS4 transposase
VIITHGKVHEVNILDQLAFEAGAFYVMDRAYLNYQRLYRLQLASAFFVTRAKKNSQFQRLYSQPVDRSTGVICDQVVTLKTHYPNKHYPEKLRRIRYTDPVTKQKLVFLTNNFSLPPLVIAQLYRSRWKVELFFKWIKQNLRIKKFYGTSKNALKTQIWIAISIYLLVAIVKKQLGIDASLYRILQTLSLIVFEKTPIFTALSGAIYDLPFGPAPNQLILFD